MKKFLALSLLAVSIGATAVSAEAKTSETSNSSTVTTNAVDPQIRIQLGQNRRNNRRVRVVTQVRNIRVGRQLYRETIQVRYLPNGRTTTRVISRVRIR